MYFHDGATDRTVVRDRGVTATPGHLITFYSFKGGVGRSMALANAAWLLASNGKRVLAVDFDLEAPGLDRYFGPFLDPELSASTPGVIDWFTDFMESALALSTALPSIHAATLPPPCSAMDQYRVRLDWSFPGGGVLDFMPPGRLGPAYDRRVSQFDWERFYSHFGGYEFVESIKRTLRAEYDYVLVDSRTGTSETTGICTVQIPDVLVVLFSPTHQAIEGAARVAESVDTRRRNLGETPPRIFPIPTRIELAERERLARTRDRVARTFSRFLWHLPAADHARYWSDVEILHFPFYAYEETLCTFADDPRAGVSMLASIERICRYLTDGAVDRLPPMDEVVRHRALQAFADRSLFRRREKTCFISYSSHDDEFARALDRDLRGRGIKCWFAPRDLPVGAKTRSGIDNAIHAHDRMIIVLSESSIRSTWVEKEVETAFEREAVSGQTILLPIRLDGSVMTTNQAWASDITRQRNIGDFSAWRDKASYGVALAQLLKSFDED
jgi:MinD-like ATPase involved in chromosome partitioning or flagellar assembly